MAHDTPYCTANGIIIRVNKASRVIKMNQVVV